MFSVVLLTMQTLNNNFWIIIVKYLKYLPDKFLYTHFRLLELSTIISQSLVKVVRLERIRGTWELHIYNNSYTFIPDIYILGPISQIIDWIVILWTCKDIFNRKLLVNANSYSYVISNNITGVALEFQIPGLFCFQEAKPNSILKVCLN